MFYLLMFRDSNLTVAWHDTNGPIKDNAPQIIPIRRDLPKVNVEMGSLVSTAVGRRAERQTAGTLRRRSLVGLCAAPR